MQNVFVGRQPIYDLESVVFGYELLYRSGETVNRADFSDGDLATSQVILNAFVEIGLESLVGDSFAFINFTENFLVQGLAHQLPPGRVVLEILEDVTVNDALLAAVGELAGAGYTIALDDFIYRPDLEPLLQFAHFVKVDVMGVDRKKLAEHTEQLKKFNVRLLAEKIETKDEFEYCKSLGYEFFQGYFFSKPTIVKGQKIAPNRLAVLQLLAKLSRADTAVADLEKAVSQDVTLSFKLLKIINSALYALPRKVQSVRQAILLLGRERIRSWVTLLALGESSDKPSELMVTAMVRAKMCERLAVSLGRPKEMDSYFTVGLFSALDAILDAPMEEIAKSLPLEDDLLAALLKREGQMGAVLNCTLAYERWPMNVGSGTS
jgi:c-di-GMP phosphodiesterase